MDFGYFIDLVKFAFALGLTYFVYCLYKAFKGGVMESSFNILTISMGMLAASEVAALVGNFWTVGNYVYTIQAVLQISFSLFALYGFYKLYAFWRFDDNRMRQLAAATTDQIVDKAASETGFVKSRELDRTPKHE